MFDEIKELTDLAGPVGQEAIVQERMTALWSDAGATVRRTRLGNVLADVGSRGPRILLAAHADELCYVVRSIDADGFLWLANGQAWMRSTSVRNWFAVGQPVIIMARSGNIPGFIASASGHLATVALKDPTELTWNDFWVETGLTADELRELGVTPGTRIIWDAPLKQYGPHITGKALDDRAPLAVLTEVLRRAVAAGDDLNCQLTFASTVQEEVGVIGASALASQDSNFDAAIVVEIGLAGDIPSVGINMMPLRLGGGPVLVHKDAGVHYDHALTAALEQAAADADITIQHGVFGSFGSDGRAFMQHDIPAAMVAFAARYTHSPFETAHLGDIERLTDWIAAYVLAQGGDAA